MIRICLLWLLTGVFCFKHCSIEKDTAMHCAPKPAINQVTVNEHNVFKHIVLPEECGELSKDSLHQDPMTAYQHGDTLELRLNFYKK